MARSHFPIKDFGGLNRLDGADRVLDNQFFQLQNFYPATKGLLYKRAGSTSDLTAAQIPGCAKITGLHRHYSRFAEPCTLYHCEPDTTLRPVPTQDLVLTEVLGASGADLFGGGSIVPIRVCYTWVGQGGESIYNTASRAGYVSTVNTSAWSQPGHQSITVGAADSAIQITVPAFPAGVRSANVYAAIGTSTNMTFIGTVTQSGGSLTWKYFIGPWAARTDALPQITLTSTSGGSLKAGTYYVSCAWISDSGQFENPTLSSSPNYTLLPAPPFNANVYLLPGTNQIFLQLFQSLSGISVGMTASGAGIPAGSTVTGIFAASGATPPYVTISNTITGALQNPYSAPTITAGIPSFGLSSSLSTAAWQAVMPGQFVYSPTGCFATFPGYTTVSSVTAPSGGYGAAIGITEFPISTQSGANVYFGIPATVTFGYAASTQMITLPNDNMGISVSLSLASSTNGARAVYVFAGTQDASTHPMQCVGTTRSANGLTINSIPDGSNAQSFNTMAVFGISTSTDVPAFCNALWPVVMASNYRTGFLIKKTLSGLVTEILPSRTMRSLVQMPTYDPTTLSPNGSSNLVFAASGTPVMLWGYIRTGSDTSAGTAINYNKTLYPVDFAYLNGLSFFVNGADIPWQTDGKTLGVIVPQGAIGSTVAAGTTLPPNGRFISVWQDQLLLAGAGAGNQVYACNSNSPRNWWYWSQSGGGPLGLRFVTIGDLMGDSPTALSVFARTTDAINDPSSYFLAFKKHGVWMLNAFPDPTSQTSIIPAFGASMHELSGRFGSVAPRSICSTPLGVLYVGFDGDVYMIRGGSEPYRIGTKIKAMLKHLVGNDGLMSQCSAVYHDDHYKISYPSSSTSTGNDAQLWADLRTMDNSPIQWSGPHTGISIGAQTVYVGESDTGDRVGLLSTGAGSVKLDDTSTFTDLGTPVVSQLQTKTFRFQSLGNLKRYFGALLDAYFDTSLTHTVLVEFFADEFYAQVNLPLSSGGGTYDASQFDQALWSDAFYEGIPALIGDMNLVGRTLYVRVTHSNPNPFILAGMELALKPERRVLV